MKSLVKHNMLKQMYVCVCVYRVDLNYTYTSIGLVDGLQLNPSVLNRLVTNMHADQIPFRL